MKTLSWWLERMADTLLALMRSVFSLAHPRVWLYLLAPALFSLLLWLGLAIWGLSTLVERLLSYPPMTLLVSWGAVWLAHLLAYVGGWMLIFALAYLTASLLAAVLVMPWLLRHVAERNYPDVAAMGADSFAGAVGNSLLAALFFIAAWLISIPFWLIPGFSLLLPLLLMAWYNRRTFAYDALSLHATADEWQQIRQQHRRGFYFLGLVLAVLAHVPLLGLLVPGLAALAYVHFGLEALRRQRGGALVTGEAYRVVE